ncbi:MAG: hypothetical protein JNL70_28305 [Saprospiraceae bacterium]|nr:hypothetical protein [Saprospiraceae bacterium]
MLNRTLTISILVSLNVLVFVGIASKYDLASVNNWLMIASIAFMSMGIYRVLGMVEGYKN